MVNIINVCPCSLLHAGRIRLLWLYHTAVSHRVKGPIFGGNVVENMCFGFLYNSFFFLKRFSLLRSIQRDIVNCSLMKFEFSGQIFEEF